MPPNYVLERAGTDKVLARGARPHFFGGRCAPRALLRRRRAAAELGSWATRGVCVIWKHWKPSTGPRCQMHTAQLGRFRSYLGARRPIRVLVMLSDQLGLTSGAHYATKVTSKRQATPQSRSSFG